MDSDIPKKMSGLFKAFKACTAKIKRIENQSKYSEDHGASLTRCLQAILPTNEVTNFDANRIAIAIGKAFLAIEGQNSADSSCIHDRIEQLTEIFLNTSKRSHNYNLYCYAFNATKLVEPISSNPADSLKRNIESCISSLFKKLKKITSTIIFITTRNFSIQKNLSISA